MDAIGQYIATMHQTLGHEKTRQIVGGEDYPRKDCVLCQFEQGRATKQQVIDAIGVET
jgi:hypothetical protein